MLDKGSELDWFSSSTVVFLAIMAFVFLVVLVIWEFYQKNPIVNVRLFLNRNFVAGSVSLMVASVVFVGGIVIIPLWLQNSMGYTSFTSGQTTATSGILVIFLAPIIGANIHKFDARKLTVFGFVTFSIISIGLSQYSTDTTQGYIALTRFLTGGALAFFFLPLNTITLSEIDDKDMTSASGLYNFMRNIGNSVGVSLSVSLWQNKIAEHHEILTSNITTSNPIYMNYLNKIPNGTPANTASLFDGLISQQAVVMAVNDVMQVSGIIILLLIPFIFLAKKPSKAVAMGH
jgi:DHA2 family multidrug resistance protein